MSDYCEEPSGEVPDDGFITYEIPSLRLVMDLNTDAGKAFANLCTNHRQVLVDSFVDDLLTAVNQVAPPGHALVRNFEDDVRRMLAMPTT